MKRQQLKMSELIAVGLKYFTTESGETHMLFKDGTEIWHRHVTGWYSELTAFEDDDFACRRDRQSFDVVDDIGLAPGKTPNFDGCLRRV